ncbi:MAG: LpxD N-terminal domain-containing protein [Bacteroidota bacterium]
MKLPQPYTLGQIAALIDCQFVGDENHLVTGINEIHMVESGDLVFVDHPKYYDKALESKATTILIDKEVECPVGKGLIISKVPFDDYNKLTRHFSKFQLDNANDIDPSALIYPNVSFGKNVKIGKNVIIYSNASIQDNVTIDDNAIIGPNTVIGHFAFYYKRKPEGYDRMHSCGGVYIGKNVEIGGLCTIDAGVSGITFIGDGTKIDNQVQIGHDTVVGKNCLFAAHVGIAGCVRIMDNVILWGQVGCASDVTIGEGAIVYAQSGIGKDLEGGKKYFGSPCEEARDKFKEMAMIKQLPELFNKLK